MARLAALLDKTISSKVSFAGKPRRTSRLKDINCYRGIRHRRSCRPWPTDAQRPTRKGPAKTVAGKRASGSPLGRP